MAEIRNTYRHIETRRLRELRSMKVNRVRFLQAIAISYFTQQELRQLRGQIKRIDVELHRRFLQIETELE